MTERRNVAVLGGGMAGLAAAYALSDPACASYVEQVTVHQRGWLLGGKGASVRGGDEERIEEHGLHVWFGFYDNAFRILNDCYQSLGEQERPFPTVQDAFLPLSTVVLTERRPGGWVPWELSFPQNDRVPGQTDGRTEPASLWDLVRQALQLAIAQIQAARGNQAADPQPAVRLTPVSESSAPGPAVRVAGARPPVTPRPAVNVDDLVDRLRRLLDSREMRLIETVLAGAFGVATSLGNDPRDHAPQSHSRLLRMVERGIELVGNYLRPLAEGSDLLRRQIYLVDILLACVRGVLADGLLVLGTDVVDDVDFTDWLEHHGAAPESARCALIRAAVYDLAFAYRNGDTEQPSCSAATALRGLARMVFDYKGSLAYKMRAGMGETVFAPIYLALLRRGVRFEFFHNVTRLELSADASRVERVHIAQQAPLRPQGGEWPLRTVQGMHCWQPAPPAALVDSVPAHLASDPQQLGWQLMYGDGVGGADACDTGPSGAASRDVVLESGEHFTDVVLAISLGALRHVCRDLIDVDWRWREMVEQVATVGTQSLQLWFENSTADLGDPVPGAITCGFVDPFDTYADMSHLLEWESWEKPAPRAVAYFCSALPWEQEKERVSLEQQQSANEHVRRHAIRFLEKDLGSLLPSTTHRYPSGFRWDSLIPTATGAEGFERQYLRANIDPSDRYVQSLPGTSRYRLRPDDSGFANLYLAGDWTDCGLNAGCIEAAATAGLLAARAICRSPATSAVVGHDHLRRPR